MVEARSENQLEESSEWERVWADQFHAGYVIAPAFIASTGIISTTPNPVLYLWRSLSRTDCTYSRLFGDSEESSVRFAVWYPLHILSPSTQHRRVTIFPIDFEPDQGMLHDTCQSRCTRALPATGLAKA